MAFGGLALPVVHVRPALGEDRSSLCRIFREPEVYRYLFDGVSPTDEIVENVLCDLGNSAVDFPLGFSIIATAQQPFAGFVRLSAVENSGHIELIYALSRPCWGTGLATAAVREAARLAFEAGFACIVAGVDEPNHRSAAVLQRVGFVLLRQVDYPLGRGQEFELRRDSFPGLISDA